MKKVLGVLVTILFGLLAAMVVSGIGMFFTLAVIALTIAFCAVFDLYPDYTIIAAIVGIPTIAALILAVVIKYLRALTPPKSIREQKARTEQKSSAQDPDRAK